jgi:hypothetical protein
MKALEKDRGSRYDSASALASDVRNFLEGNPVSAGAPTAFYITKKLILRHRIWFSAAAVIAFLLIAGAVSSTVLWQRAELARSGARALTVTLAVESAGRQKSLAEAEGLVSRLLGDVGPGLERRGRTAVLEEVALRSRDYFTRYPVEAISLSPIPRRNSEERVARALALRAWDSGDPQAALKLLPGAENCDGSSTEDGFLLASVLADAGDSTAARNLLEKMVADQGDDPPSLTGLTHEDC